MAIRDLWVERRWPKPSSNPTPSPIWPDGTPLGIGDNDEDTAPGRLPIEAGISARPTTLRVSSR